VFRDHLIIISSLSSTALQPTILQKGTAPSSAYKQRIPLILHTNRPKAAGKTGKIAHACYQVAAEHRGAVHAGKGQQQHRPASRPGQAADTAQSSGGKNAISRPCFLRAGSLNETNNHTQNDRFDTASATARFRTHYPPGLPRQGSVDSSQGGTAGRRTGG